MAEKSQRKSGSLVKIQTSLKISESATESFEKKHVDKEDNRLLSVKFEKLSVSSKNSTYNKQKLLPEMKSEKEALKLRKFCKNSKRTFALKKSKLGESFKTFRCPKDMTTANQDYNNETTSDVFGRKFSLGVENFENLSLLENKEIETDDVSKYSGETFKKINVCACKRKRAPTPEGETQGTPTLVSCGQQARMYSDVTADELAGYLEDTTFFPKRMSYMAEMMYT